MILRSKKKEPFFLLEFCWGPSPFLPPRCPFPLISDVHPNLAYAPLLYHPTKMTEICRKSCRQKPQKHNAGTIIHTAPLKLK